MHMRCLLLGVLTVLGTAQSAPTQATVYFDPNRTAYLELGHHDTSRGAAVASYEQADGWGKLWLSVTALYADTPDGAFSLGFAEGYLTSGLIDQLFKNNDADWFGADPSLRAPVYSWLSANLAWVRTQATTASPFWVGVRLLLAQLDGLYQGYKAGSTGNQQLRFNDLVLLNADGDVESLTSALGFQLNRSRNLRCSAMFKLAPGNSDVLFSHATWVRTT